MALWTPAEVSTDLWHDAADSSSITIVTGASEWRDKKGNGKKATQSTGSKQPVIIAGGLNGLDILRFTAASQQSLLGSVSLFSGSTHATVFVVYAPRVTTGFMSVFGQTDGVTTNTWRDIEFRTDGAVGDPYLATYAGDLTDSVTISATPKVASWKYDGTTLSLYRHGALIASAARTLNTVNVPYKIGTNFGDNYASMDLAEIIVVLSALSDADRQLFDGYLHWRWGLQDNLAAYHPYKDAAPVTVTPHILSLIEQPYGDAAKYITTCQQFFSLRLQAALIQYYGDTPQLRAKIDQYWGSYAVLRRLCSMPYGDARQLRQMLEMGWTENAGLRAIMEQRYSISGGQYRALCEEVYSQNEYDILRQSLDQIFIISPGDAIVQRPVVSVTTADGIDLDPYHITIDIAENEYAIKGEIHLADEAQYLSCKHLVTEVTVSVDDTDYILIVEAPRRSRPDVGVEQYYVPLASRTILLDAPYATPLTREFSGAMASAIVAEMAAIESISVDWQMIDWYIPSATLYANAETPLAVIKKVVGAARGILQTSPAGVLICRPEYPVSVKDWETSTPDFYLTDMDNYYSIESTPQIRDDYNRFSVSDQDSSSAGVTIESVDIDANSKRVLIYQIPWDDSQPLKLLTSGGAWVGIVKNGVVEEEITELIEIIAGEGNTSKPIYLTKWATGESCAPTHGYKQAVLGAITTAEDGHLSTEVSGNSLVEITYTTRYYESIVTDALIEEVQFYSDFDEVAV